MLVIFGILNLMYIPSQLIVAGDAAQSLKNIQQLEMLFRWGIIFGIISYLAFMGLVLALFQLLHQVNKPYAQLMLVLVLVSIPISFNNLLHKFTILNLISENNPMQELTTAVLQQEVMFYLDAYNDSINISRIFRAVVIDYGNKYHQLQETHETTVIIHP